MTPRPTRESEHSFTPNSPELRESEDLSSALIEEAPFGVYLVDGDFKLRAINRGSRAVFAGIEPLLGRALK